MKKVICGILSRAAKVVVTGGMLIFGVTIVLPALAYIAFGLEIDDLADFVETSYDRIDEFFGT